MSSTAELRWFFPGEAPAALARWFAAHTPEEVERTDRYLRLPGADALGVKLRGGSGPLELKLRRQGETVEALPGGASGRLELWQKWSLRRRPWAALAPRLAMPRQRWADVAKRRRTATFAWAPDTGASLTTVAPAVGCRAELAIVSLGGRATCTTLGFEAFGPDDLVVEPLLATVRALLGEVGPVEGLTVEDSYGYPAWLDHMH